MRRSDAVPALLNNHLTRIALAWLALVGLGSLPRILFPLAPVVAPVDIIAVVAPYLLVALAPIAGYLLASAYFPAGKPLAQPKIRFALYGRWQRLDPMAARGSDLFGPAGFMASLLIGLMLNVVFRSFEFLLAIPAMTAHAPAWGQQLFQLMSADVIVMNFLYMACFVMALRAVPLFPRMLLFVWAVDLSAQLLIAHRISLVDGLPQQVALSLEALLRGNVSKVLISAFVWIPYLLLSDRVNITYRHRMRAPG